MTAAFRLTDQLWAGEPSLPHRLAHSIDVDRTIITDLLPAGLRLLACISVIAVTEAGAATSELRIEALAEFDGAPVRTIVSVTVDDTSMPPSDAAQVRARYQAMIDADRADCLVACLIAATRDRADTAEKSGGWDTIWSAETFAGKLVARGFIHNEVAKDLLSLSFAATASPRPDGTTFWGNYRGYLEERFPDIAVHAPQASAARRGALPSLFCDTYDRVTDPIRRKIRFVHAPDGWVAVAFRDASFRAAKRALRSDQSDDLTSFSLDRRMCGYRLMTPPLFPEEPFEPQEPAIDTAMATARRLRALVEEQFTAVERLLA